MTKISSTFTYFNKRIFPVIWFSVVGFLVWESVRCSPQGRPFQILLIPVLMMSVAGIVAMRKLIWSLVDEVYDGGEYLVVRNRGNEERVQLANIEKVDVRFSKPPRITLRLAQSSPGLGKEIAFMPATGFRYSQFSPIEIADELVDRVDRARSGRAV
jgi:hypothetical protein